MSRTGLGGLLASQRPAIAAVSAPAGYGKSTLMVEWVLRDPRRSAWVTLDSSDNDPVAMLQLVAGAVDALNPVHPAVLGDLASPGVSILGRVVPRLAATLMASEPFLLVLDDLHAVEDQDCRDALTLLVDHVPSGSTVAATSRGEVWLNLARQRVRGGLLELGLSELAFDLDEANELLAAADVELAPEVVAELHRRTEGWPAGLYLGALALRDAPDPASALELFAGDDRFIADYLHSEIIDRAPHPVRLFLTRTSVLDELCGSLCDRTLASSGSAEALVSIEQTNRFLVPLDHRREWYRYHRLFRDLLQAELIRAEPGLVAELHRRAADWYEENGRPETAVEHVIASGDRERAAHLVCRSALPAYQSGHLTTASRWLTRFTEEEVEQHPWLAVTAGWICAYTGRPMEAVRWAAAAERGSYTGPPPDGSASIESARAFLRAAMCPNGVAALVADAELIESAEPQWSPWRPSALVHVFFARQLSGDNEAAEAALENLIALVEPMNHTNMPFALTQRSLMAMDRGEWCAASADLERARALIAKLHIQEYGASAAAFAASARLAAHDQDLDAARDYLAHAMRLRPQYTWALPVLATKLRLELARVLLALADPAGARSVLREVDEILRHRPELGTLNLEIDNLRHRLNTSPGGTAGVTSLSPAELRLLPYLQTHLTHREIGQRLYISMNTVRTHTKSIYRKLDVSTRTGAVEKARLVGLLAG